MNVLITGGAGFIGSHLVDHLLAADKTTTVTVIDNLITGNIENLKPQLDNPRLSVVIDSVCNRLTMEPLIKAADMVYHLAAPVGVKFIMDHPVLTLLDNVRGIDVVLDYCNKYRRRVLIASSSEVYGLNMDYIAPKKTKHLDEESMSVMGSTKNHRWAYANTKAFDEFLAFAYKKEFGLPMVIVRFFNTIGPRQTGQFGMVVPSFVNRALSNESITIYGTGKQTRCFIYVKDVVAAIVKLMNTSKAYGEVYNIGGEEEISMVDLAHKVVALSKSKSGIKFLDYKSAYGDYFEDMMRRTPSTGKITKATGWKSRYTLDNMLKEIIATAASKTPL